MFPRPSKLRGKLSGTLPISKDPGRLHAGVQTPPESSTLKGRTSLQAGWGWEGRFHPVKHVPIRQLHELTRAINWVPGCHLQSFLHGNPPLQKLALPCDPVPFAQSQEEGGVGKQGGTHQNEKGQEKRNPTAPQALCVTDMHFAYHSLASRGQMLLVRRRWVVDPGQGGSRPTRVTCTP